MPGKPLLFLDVDGVLNPYGCAAIPDGFVAHDLFPDEEPVLVCAEHGEWIAELADRFEVVWATGWNEQANHLLAPLLGIRPLPVAVMPSSPFAPEAKVAVADAYGATRPIAWIDDAHTELGVAWAADRLHPTLLVPCLPSVGLTHAHVAQALTWADSLSAR